MINNAPLVQDSITYGGFGQITAETVPAMRGRYAWTGRELDVETGLQFNRARYYDSGTGRWLTQDPLGFDAGDSNLYQYVKNEAMNRADPSGLEERLPVYLGPIGDVVSYQTGNFIQLPPNLFGWHYYKPVKSLEKGAARTIYKLHSYYLPDYRFTDVCQVKSEWVATVKAFAESSSRAGEYFWIVFDRDASLVIEGKETPDLLAHEQVHIAIGGGMAASANAFLKDQIQADSGKYAKYFRTTGESKEESKDKAYNLAKKWAGTDLKENMAKLFAQVNEKMKAANEFYDREDQSDGGKNPKMQSDWNKNWFNLIRGFQKWK